jgi:hypothetical protein
MTPKNCGRCHGRGVVGATATRKDGVKTIPCRRCRGTGTISFPTKVVVLSPYQAQARKIAELEDARGLLLRRITDLEDMVRHEGARAERFGYMLDCSHDRNARFRHRLDVLEDYEHPPFPTVPRLMGRGYSLFEALLISKLGTMARPENAATVVWSLFSEGERSAILSLVGDSTFESPCKPYRPSTEDESVILDRFENMGLAEKKYALSYYYLPMAPATEFVAIIRELGV